MGVEVQVFCSGAAWELEKGDHLKVSRIYLAAEQQNYTFQALINPRIQDAELPLVLLG